MTRHGTNRPALASWLNAHRAQRARAGRTRRVQSLLLLAFGGLASISVPLVQAGRPIAAGLVAFAGVSGVVAGRGLWRRWAVVTVRGPSMEPTYQHGDRVLVRRIARPRTGQVAVVEQTVPGTRRGGPQTIGVSTSPVAVGERSWLIKRVVAVAGEPVPRTAGPALARVGEPRVPEGMLVLLGDNAEASVDSRTLGLFPEDRVLGVVVRRLPAGGRVPIS
ncbi:S26 family signal peptidase [Streptomyces hainanensis]|uniref:S26 family signal peptidase n=1 Tax=Streptomyces hainanensis TaxID=402648 RepID=A0A4R4TTW0_9ACTN|nr:S26 family signal peptidase [Streptomyces hainanensis]TDC78972.1 S26 family signal peptidase [Streptomyces hainanensis]